MVPEIYPLDRELLHCICSHLFSLFPKCLAGTSVVPPAGPMNDICECLTEMLTGRPSSLAFPSRGVPHLRFSKKNRNPNIPSGAPIKTVFSYVPYTLLQQARDPPPLGVSQRDHATLRTTGQEPSSSAGRSRGLSQLGPPCFLPPPRPRVHWTPSFDG